MLCYIAVGSNLGNRNKNITDAIQALKKTPGINVKKVSTMYETGPVGGPPQGMYLNGVIEIETDLTPRQLLYNIHDIEDKLGRSRTVRNGPRTIDLDILLYGDKKMDEPDLKIPHPRMNSREFVIRPLKEIMEGNR